MPARGMRSSRFVKVIGVTLVVSQATPPAMRVKVIGVSHPPPGSSSGSQATPC